eukprot:113225-Pyramimonas_sp.AAC.1
MGPWLTTLAKRRNRSRVNQASLVGRSIPIQDLAHAHQLAALLLPGYTLGGGVNGDTLGLELTGVGRAEGRPGARVVGQLGEHDQVREDSCV